MAWCSVEDNGIGIPEKDQGKVFEAFFQSDIPGGRLKEGTGLGLSICKQYVEIMGGEIWVQSTPGEGSTFTFTMPLPGQGALLPENEPEL